ncbi:hypothetical protein, partial [Caballeronia mineralivorans]|uniref:hypothetical protein n=1 Tax=Caballeronia mineralivorans TaxID=2010198 RepID=UPI0023EFA320
GPVARRRIVDWLVSLALNATLMRQSRSWNGARGNSLASRIRKSNFRRAFSIVHMPVDGGGNMALPICTAPRKVGSALAR